METYASTIIPFKEFTSVGDNLNIMFDYEKILTIALQSLGLYEKASKDGVEIAFTLDYAQICKRRGHVLAGIKIADKDARHLSSKELLFQNGNGAQANEELVCIPLHFVNAKESHELFKTDLKTFLCLPNNARRMELQVPNHSLIIRFQWTCLQNKNV